MTREIEHVSCVPCGHPACTCCVSIEVAPFIPLFFAARFFIVPGSPLPLHLTAVGGKYDGFTLQEVLSRLQTASSWDVAKQGGNLLFDLVFFHSSIYITPDVWRHDSR